jgi:predicted Zn-dependent peptidase
MKRAEAPVRGKQVYLAWSLPASWGPDHTYETLTAPQLSRVIRSRLPFARGLKGDQSDASLGCQYLPGRVAARMLCRIDLPAQADAQHVVELVIGSLDAQWGISAREQQDRVRQLSNLVASTFQQALAQSDDLSVDGAEARAHQRHVVGTTAPVVAELDQALAVDPDRLARTAATWLTAERAAILVVEPGAAVSDDREDLPRLEAKLNATGTPSWRPSDPPLDVQRSTLANGLQVVRSYRGAAPATRMALERPVGELLAPDGARFYWDSAAVYRMPGVSFTDLRKEAGVSSWEALDLGGSSLHAFSSDGSSGLAAWSLRVWLDSLSMDPAYVQTSVDRALETLEGDLATWPLLHTRSLRAAHLFPDHPWARPWWQDVALARKTRQGEVMKWRKAMDRADLATLLVVSPDDGALTAADKYLSKWKGSNGEPAPAPTVPAPPADRRVMALATDDLLTDVRVECRLAPKTDANDAAHEVLGALLRRGVWQTLREGGGSYAPSATTKVPGPGLASMELQAQVPRTHAPAATLALLDLLALVAAGIDDDVLASARLDAAGAHARRHASTLAHFHSLHQRAQSGLSIDAIAGYRERIDNVDAAAVTELLADCVGHEAVTVVGANPAPGLEAAGLAPVDIDWRQRAVDEARSVR